MPRGYPIDLTGRTFSFLTVTSEAPKLGISRRWHCKCVCGKEPITHGNHLLSGTTKSCGCMRTALMVKRQTTHNMSRTKIYGVWSSMLNRCRNPKHPAYPHYGARGITVCQEWMDFATFFSDMGERPAGHQLDRINNDGPYSPDNCRWTDTLTQHRNRRNTIRVTHNGETKFLVEWAKQFSANYDVMANHYRKHGSIARFQPPE